MTATNSSSGKVEFFSLQQAQLTNVLVNKFEEKSKY